MEWILALNLAVSVVILFLLSTFLYGFLKFYRLIEPFIEQYGKLGGQTGQIPSFKQAAGLLMMKVVSELDVKKLLGNLVGGPK